MSIENPPHPGCLILQKYMEPLELNIFETSRILDVKWQTLYDVVNERAEISPEMAIHLEQVFGRKAETWLKIQAKYSLSQARRKINMRNVNNAY